MLRLVYQCKVQFIAVFEEKFFRVKLGGTSPAAVGGFQLEMEAGVRRLDVLDQVLVVDETAPAQVAAVDPVFGAVR